jgi:hypothetical protein
MRCRVRTQGEAEEEEEEGSICETQRRAGQNVEVQAQVKTSTIESMQSLTADELQTAFY